jgi:hypothetical protein
LEISQLLGEFGGSDSVEAEGEGSCKICLKKRRRGWERRGEGRRGEEKEEGKGRGKGEGGRGKGKERSDSNPVGACIFLLKE